MKIAGNKILSLGFLMSLVVAISLLLGGCSDVRPLDPQTPSSPATGQTGSAVKVTYNYGDSGNVQLSSNDITLKVGQKLILEPASGLTKNTRFLSAGESFFGDIMTQEANQSEGKLIFTAKAAGKGKLQIIPNSTETDRATDLWVTVQ